jgi:hypothetical protein
MEQSQKSAHNLAAELLGDLLFSNEIAEVQKITTIKRESCRGSRSPFGLHAIRNPLSALSPPTTSSTFLPL